MQWSRADEHGWDPKGPPTLADMEAALDEKGNVTAWYAQFYIPEGGAEWEILYRKYYGEEVKKLGV